MSGRRPDDPHRNGLLSGGRQWDDRRRMNHGRRAGHFVCCRHPGIRRRGHGRPGAAAGRRQWPDRRTGAQGLPREGHHHAGYRCAGGHRGTRQYAGRCSAGHLHAGRQYGGGHRGTRQHAGRCSAGHLHAGRQYGVGHRGSCQCAGCCSAGHHLHGRHHPAGRQCVRCWCAGCRHAGRLPGSRPYGGCWRASCRRERGHERAGRCSRRRSRATLPGRPGKCRCGRNPACSPVSHPAGCSGPDGCQSSCFHPDCWAAGQCFQRPGCQAPARRCFQCHRTGPCRYRWRAPDRYLPHDPGPHRCWDGPDRRRHLPNGPGPVPAPPLRPRPP